MVPLSRHNDRCTQRMQPQGAPLPTGRSSFFQPKAEGSALPAENADFYDPHMVACDAPENRSAVRQALQHSLVVGLNESMPALLFEGAGGLGRRRCSVSH